MAAQALEAVEPDGKVVAIGLPEPGVVHVRHAERGGPREQLRARDDRRERIRRVDLVDVRRVLCEEVQGQLEVVFGFARGHQQST